MAEPFISLFELNKQIKDTLHSSFANTYWIVAEISEIREVRNGHCYLELIEKDENTDQIIAKSRANIWAYTYRLLKPYFQSATGQTLTAGIKVMLRVSIDYQEVYGISLNVRDIDPAYTLGDMAQKKQAILNKLAEDGVIDMNKELTVPPVPQRIAVISSPTAAGYEDFCNQLNNNSNGYRFYIKLFPATMQGEQTEESVTSALDRIYKYENIFDVVVIIRGGGSTSDLMCFDNYWIAYNIAQFPLPVFSGIGHERDETVVDYVAHTRLKTPTAVAEHILNLVTEFDNHLNELKDAVIDVTYDIIESRKNMLLNVSNKFKPLVNTSLIIQKNKLDKLVNGLVTSSMRFTENKKKNLNYYSKEFEMIAKSNLAQKRIALENFPLRLQSVIKPYFNQKKSQLNLFEKTNFLLDPKQILKKGYSITFKDGVVVKDSSLLKKGDRITTVLKNGSFEGTVDKLNE